MRKRRVRASEDYWFDPNDGNLYDRHGDLYYQKGCFYTPLSLLKAYAALLGDEINGKTFKFNPSYGDREFLSLPRLSWKVARSLTGREFEIGCQCVSRKQAERMFDALAAYLNYDVATVEVA